MEEESMTAKMTSKGDVFDGVHQQKIDRGATGLFSNIAPNDVQRAKTLREDMPNATPTFIERQGSVVRQRLHRKLAYRTSSPTVEILANTPNQWPMQHQLDHELAIYPQACQL
jgi:hypothetical protein